MFLFFHRSKKNFSFILFIFELFLFIFLFFRFVIRFQQVKHDGKSAASEARLLGYGLFLAQILRNTRFSETTLLKTPKKQRNLENRRSIVEIYIFGILLVGPLNAPNYERCEKSRKKVLHGQIGY